MISLTTNNYYKNSIMKKILPIGRLLLAGLLILSINQSCTDLEEERFDFIGQDNFFQTDEQLQAGFAEAYARLRAYCNHNSFFSIQEVPSDEAMIPQRGGDWFDGGIWLRTHRHEYRADEEVVRNVWNTSYSAINLINLLLETYEQNGAEATITSELRVLRAWWYAQLLDIYGNVPIVDATDFEFPAKNSRQEVYNFVVSEVTSNIGNLSKDVASMYGRMHYYAAQSLLAKVYLNAEVYTGTAQWQAAADAADEIMNSGLFSLEADYFTNFNAANEISAEIIWQIPYDRVNLQGFNLPQMTLHYNSQNTFNLEQQPWNGYCTLAEFYNSYDDTDLRKGVSGDQKTRGNFLAGPQFQFDGTSPALDAGYEQPNPDNPDAPVDPDGIELVFTPEINEHFPNCLRQAGVRIGKYEFVDGATPELDNDFPLYRLADIMMVKAEALLRLSKDVDEALALVNEIRTRAGVDSYTELNPDNLLAERGREMFAETWRRQDLIRFGKYGDEWGYKPASGADKEIFPIPQDEINVNPNITQNDGY